jgi:hypothetical protein
MSQEQIIVAAIQGIVSIAILIAVLWKNSILKTQIEKSNAIISNIEAYQKLIDLQKLKEFVDISEQTILKKTEMEKKELEQKLHREIIEPLKTENEQTKGKYGEVVFAVGYNIVNFFKQEKRKEVVLKRYPLNKEILLDFIEMYQDLYEKDGDKSMEAKIDEESKSIRLLWDDIGGKDQ